MPLYRASANAITIRKNTGVDVGTRPRVNFIEGSGTVLTVTDDAGSNEVDLTIARSGGGSYTITNDQTDRVINVGSMTLDELGDIVATIARDLGLAV